MGAAKEFITRQDLNNLQSNARRSGKVMLILMALILKSRQLQSQAAAAAEEDVELARASKVFLFGNIPNWLECSLEEAGFTAIACRRPEEGLERLREASLIIMADDNEWMSMAIRGLSNAPIVMLGFDADARAWDKALSLGIDAYLSRFLGRRELIARVRAILRRYHQPDATGALKGMSNGSEHYAEARSGAN